MSKRIDYMQMADVWPNPDLRPSSVLVAMSGGADSTFAALWLVRAGLKVVGVHFDMGISGDGAGPNPDPRDARLAAARLAIPFYVISAKELFERAVVQPFAESYLNGLTPNPCILCNPAVKWKLLLDTSTRLGIDAVATGHHARLKISSLSGRPRLLQAVDRKKDQSYFLSRLSRDALSKAVMVAGNFRKSEIRTALREAGFDLADRPESQDICFVKGDGYARLVERLLPDRTPGPGAIVDPSGLIIGAHPGVHNYTIGQRKGLGLAGPNPSFVLAIRARENRIVAGPDRLSLVERAVVSDLHFLNGPPGPGQMVTVKLRYASNPVAARFEPVRGEAELTFEQPQRAVTPGQTAVFYQGDEVLGAGVISPRSIPFLGYQRSLPGADR